MGVIPLQSQERITQTITGQVYHHRYNISVTIKTLVEDGMFPPVSCVEESERERENQARSVEIISSRGRAEPVSPSPVTDSFIKTPGNQISDTGWPSTGPV